MLRPGKLHYRKTDMDQLVRRIATYRVVKIRQRLTGFGMRSGGRCSAWSMVVARIKLAPYSPVRWPAPQVGLSRIPQRFIDGLTDSTVLCSLSASLAASVGNSAS